MKEKFIEVYDDILPKEIVNTIEDAILINPVIPLLYTHNVTFHDGYFNPSFSLTFYDPLKNINNIIGTPLFEIVYRLGNKLDIFVQNIIQGRIIVHLPSPNPGQDQVHIDKKEPHWVCLYYVNDSEGDTVLFDDNEKEIKRVTPKKGRIAFFDGSIKHCSTRPSTKARAIINFNFLGTQFKK